MDPKLRRRIVRCVEEISRKLFTDYCNEYDYIVVDVASIVYGLSRPETFIENLALAQQLGLYRARFILVLDYTTDTQRRVAERRLRLIRERGLDYVLSEGEPAEIKAAKIVRELQDRGYRAIVLSRDYDPLLIVDEMLQPVGARLGWIVRLIRINRDCLNNACLHAH